MDFAILMAGMLASSGSFAMVLVRWSHSWSEKLVFRLWLATLVVPSVLFVAEASIQGWHTPISFAVRLLAAIYMGPLLGLTAISNQQYEKRRLARVSQVL